MNAATAFPLPEVPSGNTKERLLDAAERLFAERGFEGTSIRAVTQAAGASVSSANYHFGSKEALLRATLMRRIEPVNQRRLERLAELEARGERPSVEEVLEAFLRPIFEMRAESADGARHVRQVAARLYSETPELVASLKRDLFGPLSQRMVAALARALPGARPELLGRGFQLTVGLMVHVASGHLEDAPGLPCPAAADDETLLRTLVSYAAAGLRALQEGAP